jgi:hypothetical protein
VGVEAGEGLEEETNDRQEDKLSDVDEFAHN